MLEIESDGQTVIRSNFWDTDVARAGKVYLSTNAGAFRLLVPDAAAEVVRELGTGKLAVVSRGPWPQAGLRDAVEVMLDDGSDSPFALHLDLNSLDRLPLPNDQGREWVFAAWVRKDGIPHKALELPCRYRVVPRLPWMKPWAE